MEAGVGETVGVIGGTERTEASATVGVEVGVGVGALGVREGGKLGEAIRRSLYRCVCVLL